jgi:hypothetical protein
MRATTPLLLLSCLTLTAAACDSAQVQALEAHVEANAARVEAQENVAVEVKQDGVAEVKTPDASVEVKAEVKVEATLKPETLDLESITYLVKKGKVKDAKALEAKINAPKEKLNDIDIDGDGKIDKIVIVEVKKDDGTIIFELHAVPSKSKKKEEAVVVAFVNFVPDKETNVLVVKAVYAPVVIGYDTIVYDYTVPIVVKNDVIVVSGGAASTAGCTRPSARVVLRGVHLRGAAAARCSSSRSHSYGHHGKWKGKGHALGPRQARQARQARQVALSGLIAGPL